MIRAHQPGSLPIDVPETIPNPAVPETTPAPTKPIPQEPVKTPEKVPANYACRFRKRRPAEWRLLTNHNIIAVDDRSCLPIFQ
jgi:hypothetical protein